MIGFVAEMMTSRYDENVVTETSRVYRVLFIDGQVLDFIVEVSVSLSASDVDSAQIFQMSTDLTSFCCLTVI